MGGGTPWHAWPGPLTLDTVEGMWSADSDVTSSESRARVCRAASANHMFFIIVLYYKLNTEQITFRFTADHFNTNFMKMNHNQMYPKCENLSIPLRATVSHRAGSPKKVCDQLVAAALFNRVEHLTSASAAICLMQCVFTIISFYHTPITWYIALFI